MDTLDDFTVMNIIGYCDMKTVFSVVPLVCRRMYELYDDVAVARRFRGELRARIEALARNFNQKSPTGCITIPENRRPPLELVAKADLGEFVLVIKINVESAVRQEVWYWSDIADKDCLATLNKFQNITYWKSCNLTATFETVYTDIGELLNGMPARIDSIAYVLYSPNTSDTRNPQSHGEHSIRDLGFGRKYTLGTGYNRATDGDRTLYDLGFGYKYTSLTVTVHFDVEDLRRVVAAD